MLLSDAVDNRRAVSSFIYFDATASATPSVLDASAEACGTFDGSIVLRRLATVHFATSSSCSDLFLSIRSCWFPAQRSRGWPVNWDDGLVREDEAWPPHAVPFRSLALWS